jgi:hypothetical protein
MKFCFLLTPGTYLANHVQAQCDVSMYTYPTLTIHRNEDIFCTRHFSNPFILLTHLILVTGGVPLHYH